MSDLRSGFGSAAYDWFFGLELDNSRGYFTSSRAAYVAHVKGPFEALLSELAKEFGGTPKVFRPNRDTRFGADKRPYKTNIGGYLAGAPAMAYLHLDRDGLMAATGYYMMANDQLARYRAALDQHPEEASALRQILKTLEEGGMDTSGEALKTAPKGYPRDHPAVDLLRLKSVTVAAVLPPDETEDFGRCLEHATKVYRAAADLNGWLDRHVGPSTEGVGLAR